MPGLSIGRALDIVRARGAGAPVLFFTGQDVPSDERELVEGVLYKLLSIDELAAAVERYIVTDR